MAIDPDCLRDLKRVADSTTLRCDTTAIAAQKYRLFVHNGRIDADRYFSFLTDFSALLDHPPRLPRPFLETDMKL
ncbi:MAG TPA: hypothetical protein ENI80_03785 [Acidiferrobacteraceae bacterium]|nr:hypothetical protein [Acidiferrobacteraceae bacterium]